MSRKTYFNAFLEQFLSNEDEATKITFYPTKGGPDKQFGPRYTGSWVGIGSLEFSEDHGGIYFINETNQYYFRRVFSIPKGQYTQTLSIINVEKIPTVILTTLKEVATTKDRKELDWNSLEGL
jgi:hypothetical protein